MYFRTLVLCGFFLLLGISHATADGAPPSAFDLMKISTHSEVELSPSGRYFSMVHAVTNTRCVDSTGQVSKHAKRCSESRTKYRAAYQIVIYDLEIGATISILPLPEDFYVQWFEWANDDRLLAAIARRTTSNARGTKVTFGGSRIISMPREQGEYVTLFEGSRSIDRSNFRISSITNTLRDDPDHVLIPANKGDDLDLWKVNVNTGEQERVATGVRGTFYWYTNNLGKPILRYDANLRGTKITVFAWSDETESWEKIKTFNLRDKDEEDDFEFFPVAPTDNPNQIYVLSDEEDGVRRAIKIYDIKEQKYVETVFEHDKYDVSGALLSVATGKYAGAWYYADRLQHHFVNKKSQAHYNALNGFFGNETNVNLLGFNKAGNKAIIYVNAPDIPGEYYVYNLTTTNIDPIMQRKPELGPAKFGKAEVLTIQTRDGETITAYLTHPSSGKDSSAPLLVMPHGGPERRDYFVYDPQVQFFAARGYRILQINFRGSSGYGRAFAEAGYGEWGGVMQNDITDAVRFLHDNDVATPDQTCIVGYSYGGYAALYGGATTPELYKCIVSGAGRSDLVSKLSTIRRDYGADSETYEYWLKSVGDPKTDREKLASRSPVNLANQFQRPVLLVHGEDDGIVGVEQSRRMKRALEKSGADVEYVELKYEGHGGWSLENEIFYLNLLEGFLQKHLQD